MSKKAQTKAKEVEVDEDQVDGAEGEGTDTEEAASTGRKIMLTVGGKSVSRADYIRKRWKEKASRGQIAKELTKLQGKPVPYQIVFAATKGLAGGPDKEAPAEETEESTED